MDGVGAVAARGLEDAVDPQVALGGRAGSQARRLVGHADVQGGAVGVGVHRHGRNSHLPQRADDAHRNLAAVGDQDLAEHADGIVAGVSGGSHTVRRSGLRVGADFATSVRYAC